MKKIVLDFEQRQEEEEYEGRCTWQWVHLAVGALSSGCTWQWVHLAVGALGSGCTWQWVASLES